MAGSEKVLLILNPVAGHGKSAKLKPLVEERLKQKGVEFETVLTERRGHAQELAASAHLNGFKIVAAMGGDGTLSEVVSGFMTRFSGKLPPGLRLAPIPSGTGNDFLGGAGLSLDWTDAVDALANPVARNVDVILVEDAAGFHRYVANCVGIGFDAYVTGRVTRLGTSKLGPLSYMMEAFRGLVHFNPGDLKVTLAGGETRPYDKTWLFAVTNSEKYGGGMKVNPGALLGDGLINIALLHGVPRSALVGLIFQVRSGKHVGKPGVVMSTGTSVTVDAPAGFPCHVDGDTVDVTYPVTVKVLPGALPLVAAGAPD